MLTKSYIEREALKRVYMGKGKDKLRLATVINELELAPAANVVEVVRCKDCVEWVEGNFGKDSARYGYCKYFAEDYGSEHFCSYGERRVTL